MKILVTGGAGFVGSHVVDAYTKAGHQVIIVDDGSTGKNTVFASDFYKLDLTDIGDYLWLHNIIERLKPDVINHHAANPSIPASIADPHWDANTNLLSTIDLLEVAKTHGVKQFIFASTSEVYGPNHAAENGRLAPQSPYAIGKMAAEEYVRWFGKQYGLMTTIFRYANIYGPRQTPEGGAVIPKFIHSLLNNIPVTLNGGGVATRDFVYVEDVAKANVLALGKEGVFNIGSGRKISIKDLLELVEEATGLTTTSEVGIRPTDFPASALVIDKAIDELGWYPYTTLIEGLPKTVAAQKITQMV